MGDVGEIVKKFVSRKKSGFTMTVTLSAIVLQS